MLYPETLESFGNKEKVIDKDSFEKLLTAISQVGLWSIRGNVGVKATGKKHEFFLPDLEQPNNTPSGHFFHKDEGRFKGNARAGLEELKAIMKEHYKHMSKDDWYFKILDAFLMSLS